MMTDPLAERIADAAIEWEKLDCLVAEEKFIATKIRAFLAERVTVEKVTKAIKSMRVDGAPIVITWSDADDLAAAVVALIQREMGQRV